MLYQDLEENWKKFSDLIIQFQKMENSKNQTILKHHIEQNLTILNQLFSLSIATLEALQRAQTASDILSAQTKFTTDLNKKITFLSQDFLNTSLRTMSDYNEWLKAHCDLATD